MMPKMNGFDVAALLKNDPVTANIPIILLTIVEDEPRGYRLGIDRYFKKPIDMPKLFIEIETLIAQGGSRKSVLIVDQYQSPDQPLTQIFQAQGYSVAQLAPHESLIQTALIMKPDMIIVNSDHPEQYYDNIRTLRYEPGLENIMFFFFQESH
jgi:response regulator RpfG family c-di-GMP phosphodiesterase